MHIVGPKTFSKVGKDKIFELKIMLVNFFYEEGFNEKCAVGTREFKRGFYRNSLESVKSGFCLGGNVSREFFAEKEEGIGKVLGRGVWEVLNFKIIHEHILVVK